MAKKLSNARAPLHKPTATVLSLGTPGLIGAAIRAVRRGANRADLDAMRRRLESVADHDPAATLVVEWLEAKLLTMDLDRDAGTRRLVDRSLPRGEA